MALFSDLLNIWRKEDLLSQAWEESLQMLDLSHTMFNKAVKKSKKQESLTVLKKLKNRDREINSYQREVRRKIFTHFALEQGTHDITSLMVLVMMIVDIERIGDYSKNILDLAINYPDALDTKHLHKDLYDIEIEVKDRFDHIIDAVKTQDIKNADNLLKGFKKHVTGASDRIVNNIIAGNLEFQSSSEAAAIALYARYLKRIGSHLKNITTTIVNPIDAIGYRPKK